MIKLTKKEMEFTVKNMIDYTISLIELAEECEEAVLSLEELKLVIDGNQDIAIMYWNQTSNPFNNDLESTKHYLCADNSDASKMMKQIFDKVLN